MQDRYEVRWFDEAGNLRFVRTHSFGEAVSYAKHHSANSARRDEPIAALQHWTRKHPKAEWVHKDTRTYSDGKMEQRIRKPEPSLSVEQLGLTQEVQNDDPDDNPHVSGS